jgi:hypothetical protein
LPLSFDCPLAFSFRLISSTRQYENRSEDRKGDDTPMATILREYTLVLTIKVSAEEDEGEIDHSRLREELQALYPTKQEKTNGRKLEVEITKRVLTRNY